MECTNQVLQVRYGKKDCGSDSDDATELSATDKWGTELCGNQMREDKERNAKIRNKK
jgi:hypothetical protein